MYIYITQQKTAQIENLKKLVPRTPECALILSCGGGSGKAANCTFVTYFSIPFGFVAQVEPVSEALPTAAMQPLGDLRNCQSGFAPQPSR